MRSPAGLLLVVGLALVSCSARPSPHGSFFEETGHFVEGEFLDYYNNTINPELIYGSPISEQFVSRDGKTVQYFQRARFEFTTDAQGNTAVTLTPIGAVLHQPAIQLEPQNPAACELIAGFQVCYDFVEFYKQNGGAAQFGLPISHAEEREGKYVQYFEKARLEWQTTGGENRVEVSPLGQTYFDLLGEDRFHLNPPEPINAAINPVLSLAPRAYVARPITRSTDEQSASVIVQDQNLRGVSGAGVVFSIRLPDGTAQQFSTTTNTAGLARVSFGFVNQPAGELVSIEVIVEFMGNTGKTNTSFRIWY
jgi:hypothetical protein